jgi:hypothetical protein
MPNARHPDVMLQGYRAMRALPLATALVFGLSAGAGCRGGALQPDDGGGGMLALDAAGARGGDGGPMGGDGSPGAADVRLPTADANCGSTTLAAGSVPPQILVLLDQSVSHDRTKWSEVVDALASLVYTNTIRVDWGLYTFPEPGAGACAAHSLATVIDIPLTPMDYMSAAHGIGFARTDGVGSPTAAAIGIGAAYLSTLPPDNPGYLMLVTDNAPSCAGTIDALVADSAQAQTDAVAAITAAAAQGFPTFVLAPSTTTGADATALDALATAGGYPQYAPGGPAFQTELTLKDQFTTPDAACTFPLNNPPPDPDNVTVAFNGAPVVRDRTHMEGWDYFGDNQYIQLFGAWCSQLLSSRVWQLTILDGCPVGVPPLP